MMSIVAVLLLMTTPVEFLEAERARVDALRIRLERQVDATVELLRETAPCGSAGAVSATTSLAPPDELRRLEEDLDSAFEDLEKARQAAQASLAPGSPHEVRDRVQRALEAADDLLARRRDANAATRWLRRVADASRDSELCRVLQEVGLPEPLTLSELREDPLLPLRRLRADIERRHNVLQRGEWSLGLGVQWTPEIEHAGKPVALVAFRPLAEDFPFLRSTSIRPWFQIGSGLDFDEPSFYIGGALDLGPYMHFGIGWTAHQAEDEYDGDLYLAMTVRLEKLRTWMRQ